MWKLIGILAIFSQLSSFTLAVERVHEVTLNVKTNKINKFGIYLDCNLMEVKSSKDQVIVTSSAEDIQDLKLHHERVYVQLAGNINYPEHFPKNLGKFLDGTMDFKYESTPLKYITRDNFKDMASELKMLHLSENEIKEIPFDVFYDLIKLNYLDIRYNKLKRLAPNLFAKSINLWSLFVGSNQLTELHPDLLKYCPDLMDISVNYNQIEELYEDLFKNNPNMSFISMSHNKIKHIPIDFAKLKELLFADFTHNSGTCDTMYMQSKPYIGYYNEEEQKKWINNVPDFQNKIEKDCRG